MKEHTFDPRIGQIGDIMLRHIDEVLAQALAMADRIDPGEGSSKQLLATMAVAVPLQFLAGSIANAPEGESKVEGVNKETMLIAALIVGRCCQANGQVGRIQFSSRNILAAIEAAGKVAGADMSPFCDPEMIRAYREGLTDTGKTDLGYWSYLENVGPSFEGFDGLAAYSASRH